MSVLFTNEMAQKILDAINTLNSNLVNARGGALSNLSTTTKSSIIAAINELVTGQGSLSSLSTSVKTSLVAAVNELLNQRGGALSNLSTNSKISIIAAINELVSGQGTLSSLSTSAKNNIVAAINELVNADVTINTKLSRIYTNSAAAHNSVYRGKNLGTSITDAQISAIRNRTFDDLYVGDCWTLPIDGTTYAYIMGFNIYYGGWGKQHAVVMLHNPNWKFSINDTDTCEGHLYNSKMYTVHLPYILGKIKEVIPEYILTHSGYENKISDAINSSGLVSHRIVSTTEQIFLPSLANVTGSEIFDNRCAYETLSRHKSWPYFLFNKTEPFVGHFLLDSNFDTTHWCFHDAVKNHYYYIQASVAWPVSPYILLG